MFSSGQPIGSDKLRDDLLSTLSQYDQNRFRYLEQEGYSASYGGPNIITALIVYVQSLEARISILENKNGNT